MNVDAFRHFYNYHFAANRTLWDGWQVLLHVGNHGADHCAQMLRLLSDLGVKTTAQDYIFYVYDNP